jgi:hypothetical protein
MSRHIGLQSALCINANSITLLVAPKCNQHDIVVILHLVRVYYTLHRDIYKLVIPLKNPAPVILNYSPMARFL